MATWPDTYLHPHAVQENNFKAVLESIRDLMNEETVLPEWLHDIFLGYGDPATAQYTKLPNTLRTLDFKVGRVLLGMHSAAIAISLVSASAVVSAIL